MTLPETLLRVERYAKKSGKAETTVSRMVFKDGKRLERLRTTGSCTIGLLERANAVLDELEAELDEGRAA